MHNKGLIFSLLCLGALLAAGFFKAEEKENNLKKFYEITAKAPLLYSPDLDPKDLKAATSHLEAKENEFLTYFYLYLTPDEAEILPRGWRLFPIDFLKSFADAVKETNNFLAAPSFSRALKLITLQRKAARAYTSHANLQLQALHDFLAKNPQKGDSKIIFLKSATTLNIVKNDYELIKQNARVLEEEINLREKCLSYGNCPAELANSRPENKEEYAPKEPQDINILPPDIAAPLDEYDLVLGPYFVKSGCLGYAAFYIFEKNGRAEPKLATENYYLDYESWRQNWKSAEIMLNSGIRYDLTVETHDYRCADLAYLPELYQKAYGKTQLAWLAKLIAENTLLHLDALIYEQQINKSSAELAYLIAARTDYSLLLMPYHSSVWRISEKPSYLLGQTFDLPKGYETYTGLKAKGYRDEIIKEFIVPRAKKLEIMKNALLRGGAFEAMVKKHFSFWRPFLAGISNL